MTDAWFDEAAEEQRRYRELAGQSLLQVRGLSPEAAAQADRSAQVLGLPPLAVAVDPSLNADARSQQNLSALDGSPQTARFLSDEDNARVASDQVESLSTVEALSRHHRDTWARNREADPSRLTYLQRLAGVFGGNHYGMGARAQALGLPTATGDVLRRVPGGFGEALGTIIRGGGRAGARTFDQTALEGVFENMARAGERIQIGGRNVGGNLRPEEVRAYDNPVNRGILLEQARTETGFVGDVAGGVGQIAAQATVAVATAGYGTLPALGLQGVGAMDERVQADMRRDGRTEYTLQDDLALIGGGIVTAASEKVGLDAVLGRLPAPIKERITSKLVDIFLAGAIEGSSELVEGVGQNALAKYLLGEDTGLLDGAAEGGQVGFTVGALARAALLTALPGRQGASTPTPREEAAANLSDFDDLVAAVNENPLRERAPERFRQFLESVTGDQTVTLPAERVRSFFQSNPDLEMWLDEWDIRDQYNEALVSNADITMSRGTYLSRVAPTQAHTYFRDDLRLGEGALTLREAEDMEAGGVERLEAAVTQARTRADEAVSQATPGQAVFDDVFNQLRAAGFTEPVARQYATVWRSRAETRAARLPELYRDALSAYQAQPLTITQTLPDTLRDRDRLDVMIEALRKGTAAPSQRSLRGSSLLEFISSNGGIVDTGGELMAMGADGWHRGRRVGTRRLVQPAGDGTAKLDPDYVRERAIENGYLPEDASIDDLYAAMREELAGRPVFSGDVDFDVTAEGNAEALDDLERALSSLGIDPKQATNEEIKAALDKLAAEPEGEPLAGYDQAGKLVTDSPAFRAWFGDSKVVGPDGQPLIVYHGTNQDIPSFDPDRAGAATGMGAGAGGAFFFTASPEAASDYAANAGRTVVPDVAGYEARVADLQRQMQEAEERGDFGAVDRLTGEWEALDADAVRGDPLTGQNVLPVYLSIQNPLVVDYAGERPSDLEERVEEARAAGHDGLILRNVNDLPTESRVGDQFAIFEPTQAKSAFNRGTFSPDDPRILYQSAVVPPSDEDVRAFGDALQDRLGLRDVDLHLSNGALRLNHLAALEQGQGKGSEAMREIVAYADTHGLRLVLTPGSRDDGMGKTSRARLVRFYKRFGLVENRGRNKDFTLSEGMYREPVAPRSYAQSVYHGSPHVFDRFSTTAMGTGEGAQAFGWGLYFTERRDLAEYYRRSLAGSDGYMLDGVDLNGLQSSEETRDLLRGILAKLDVEPVEAGGATPDQFRQALDSFGHWSLQSAARGGVEERLDDPSLSMEAALERYAARQDGESARNGGLPALEAAIRAQVARAIAKAGVLEVSKAGRLYKVTIPEDGEYLLWDRPYAEQPDKVKAALESIGIKEAPPPKPLPPTLDLIVQKALRQNEGDPDNIGLMIDNDRALYDAALRHAERHGLSREDVLEGDGPGDYIETAAKEYLDAMRARKEQTGEAIYRELSASLAQEIDDVSDGGWTVVQNTMNDKLANDHLASMRLMDEGLAGIKFLDGMSRAEGEGDYNFVIFDGDRVQITSFDQGERGRIDFTSTGRTIRLFENRDLSTFLHESGHAFLEDIMADASEADALPAGGEQLRADRDALLKWFGVERASDIATEHHEQFARAVEAYFMEGRAPSLELRSAFARFKSWLVRIYRTVARLNTPINDDIRGVLDRLLATDEQIAEATASAVHSRLFADAEAAGMTQAEFARYTALDNRSKAKAEDDLLRKVMDPLRRKATQEYREQWNKLRPGNEKEVDAAPDMAALAYLRANKVALSRDALVAMYGSDAVLKLLPQTRPMIYAKGGAMHPDALADIVGARTGEELVNLLMAHEAERLELRAKGDKRSVRDYRVDQGTDRDYRDLWGDPLTDGRLEQEALDAVHEKQRGDTMASEVNQLAKLAGVNGLWTVEAMQDFASRTVGEQRANKLRPAAYLRAERKAGIEAQRAFAKQDFGAALDAKLQQNINFHLYRAALDAEAAVSKASDLFAKVIGGREKDIAKYRNMDIVYAARGVLDAYGVTKAKQNPAEYLARMREYDPDAYAILEPYMTAALADAKPIDDLTVTEFADVAKVVDQLWRMSRRSKVVEIEGRKIEIATITAELTQTLLDSGPPRRGPPGKGGAVTDAEKRLNGFLGLKSAVTKTEEWAARKGPAFVQYVFRPVSKAADAYRASRREFIPQLLDSLKVIEKDLGKPFKIDAPELGYVFGENRGAGLAELLGALRHTGNESNLRKLLLGRDWATENPDGSLDTSRWDAFLARKHADGTLTKAHWDYVQAEWDLHEAIKPLAQKAHRAMYGRYFDEITTRPVVTPFGTYKGGYVAAKADPNIDAAAEGRAAEGLLEGRSGTFMFPGPANGFTKSRVEYNTALDLDIRLAVSQMDEVLRFAHLGPVVRDVNRILMNREFAPILRQYDPNAWLGVLLPWLERSVSQRTTTASRSAGGRFFDAVVAGIGRNTGMSIMFGSLVNTAQQVTGLSVASLRTGKRNMAHALSVYLRDPSGVTRAVRQSSQLMADRADSQMQEVADAANAIVLNPNLYEKAVRWTQHHAYFMQHGFQNVLDPIIWLAARDKAVQIGEADPEGYADMVVRTTQGTRNPEDISNFSTGPKWASPFKAFTGYFIDQANMLETEWVKADSVGRRAEIYALGFLVPSVVARLIAETLSGRLGDDEEDGWGDEFFEIAVLSQIQYALAMVPFGGQAVNSAINYFDGKRFNDRLSVAPFVSTFEAAGRVPFDFYKITQGKGDASNTVKDVLTAVALATGLPMPSRQAGYVADVLEEDVEPLGPVDATRGFLTGSASPESREP